MKRCAFLHPSVAFVTLAALAACGGAPSAAPASPVAAPVAVVAPVPPPAPLPTALATALATAVSDPVAEDASASDDSLPTLERTPAAELRPKTRADLDAALARAKIAGSVNAATSNITKRIGKPTWIENGRTRVWVAEGADECHRLILGSDGTIAIEVVPVTETKKLSGRARQKLCTGDIERAASR